MTLEIQNWRTDKTGTCIALFDVYLPKLDEFKRGLRLLKSKRGHHFIGFPSSKTTDHMGKDVWVPYNHYGPDRQSKFIEAIFEAIGPLVDGPIHRGG
jgi:DNA-binding cell septation regulator SpoVG